MDETSERTGVVLLSSDNVACAQGIVAKYVRGVSKRCPHQCNVSLDGCDAA